MFQSLSHRKRLDISFLVPTETGYQKSIIDATASMRSFLKKNKIHDFETQKQGPENKIQREITLISKDIYTKTIISLYRPITKDGDPRLWIYDLKSHAMPFDLLACINTDEELLVVNCSQTDLPRLLDKNNHNFWSLFPKEKEILTLEALELLEKLKEIGGRGHIKSLRRGDTGVGYTLETLLGIAANSSTKPDYKGIELKSARDRNRKGDRSTIFSKVPDWKNSRLKSSKEILFSRGYYSEEKRRTQLFHTISSLGPNSLGLVLDIDEINLYQKYVDKAETEITDVIWNLNTIQNAFLEKHKETFWIYADVRGRGSSEEFHYIRSKYTQGPDADRLALLLATGDVTVDYLIKELPNGSAKDQGYLFKISAENLDLLFDTPIEFSLV